MPYEVLVIDNNSTDNTQQVLAELKQRYPALRYVTEPVQGLSSARNRALRESTADVVAFIDDDCVLSRGWVEAIWHGFDDPEVATVGGVTHLEYPNNHRPDWLVPSMEGLLGLNYHGPKAMETKEVHGNNMAVRRTVAIEIGGFDAGFGYLGNKNPVAGEDVEFCRRVWATGHKIMYLPQAELIHKVHVGRLQLKWFFSRALENGRYLAIVDRKNMSPWTATKYYMNCMVPQIGLRLIGNRRRSLMYAMETRLASGELDVMLPGITGMLLRILLAAAAIPHALLRVVLVNTICRSRKQE